MYILSAQDLRTALDARTCIKAVRQAFLDVQANRYFMPLRTRFRPEKGENWMTLMPCMRISEPKFWSLKQMVVSPANAKQGLDPLQGMVLLHNGETGELSAMCEAATLTALRTAAVTALATEVLGPPHVEKIAIIGLGVQGRTHVQTLGAMYPDAAIHVWSRTHAVAATYAEEMGCTAATTIADALRDADVACTVTASREPIVLHDWFKPGCHLNAVGSSTPQARELDGKTLAAAQLFVDRKEAALSESGDILAALREQAITADHIQAELGEVLAGVKPGRTSAQAFTVYESLGFGALDLAALEAAVDAARRQGLGMQITT